MPPPMAWSSPPHDHHDAVTLLQQFLDRLLYGNQEFLFAQPSEQTATRGKGRGLDVEAVGIPGDHMSSVPEAMRQAIQFFKRKK
jgi:hypothetical protein